MKLTPRVFVTGTLVTVAIVTLVAMSGCVLTDLEHRQSMTVEDQIRVAELGLSVAREVYMIYLAELARRDEVRPDDADRAQQMYENVIRYVALLQELRAQAQVQRE